MSHKKICVIGGGVGGLSAAIALSAQHLDVTLIDQHAQFGGKIRQACVGDALIDCGPTVFTLKPVFDQLFALANTQLEDHLTVHPVSTLARHFWLDHDALDLFSDIDQSCDEIARVFNGREADNYRVFANKTQEVFNTLDARFMRTHKPSSVGLTLGLTKSEGLKGLLKLWQTKPFINLWAQLANDFESPQLQQLFARYATYCGSSPFKAPATLMLIAHAERQGVWQLEGGMYSLVTALVKLLEKTGANTRLNTTVTEIKTNARNEITGVVLNEDEQLPADAIVFAGDTAALNQGELGASAVRAVPNRTTKSLSAITRSDVAHTDGVQLAHHNVFFSQDYPKEFDELFRQQKVPAQPTLYLCAQDRGLGTPEGTEKIFTLANAPACALPEHEVARCVENIPSWLKSYQLNVTPTATHASDSPNTFAQLFPATDGALYGRPTHGMMGSFQRPGSCSSIKGLFLAGSSVHPGAGIPMVCLSGLLAADSVSQFMM